METRLESSDSNYDFIGYSYYPLYVGGEGGVTKNITSVQECTFAFGPDKGISSKECIQRQRDYSIYYTIL